MRLVVRIEADAETGEFRVAYLTGAAEWSLDSAAAFRGTREECETLAGKQPLRCMVAGCGSQGVSEFGSQVVASTSPTPSAVFEALEKRGLA